MEKEQVNPEVVNEEKIEKEKVSNEELFSDYVMKLPESEKEEENPKITEPNRPAFWSQRIAAGIIDLCLLFMACFGLYRLFVYSGLGNGLRENAYAMQEVVDYYKTVPLVEGSDETYGYKIYEDEAAYNDEKYKNYTAYTDVNTGKKYKVADYEGVTDALKAAYQKAVSENDKYKNAAFNYRLIDFGIIMLAGAISETVFLFAIPLLNKDRASLGKLAAGLKVINSKYICEAKWYQMFGRLIWTLSFESALPLLFLPTVGSLSNTIMVVLIVPLALFIITLLNKDRRTLHDFICRTRVIDKRTFVPLNEQ